MPSTLSTNTSVRSQHVLPGKTPPASARLVIVGVGIAGCSVGWHLAKLGSDGNLSNPAFPFGAVREIVVAGQKLLAIRITYVGELGWELHVSSDAMLPVYDAIKSAGATDAGHHGINAMRIEKGYRAFGHELSPDETPLEAGLGFAIQWEKDFLGRDASSVIIAASIIAS